MAIGFSLFSSVPTKIAKKSPLNTSTSQTVIQNTVYEDKKNNSFLSLGLDKWLVEDLKQISIYSPTKIQKFCIPAILDNQNVIASSETGSGKTGAFALPIISTISRESRRMFALVITPTRELALQISEQFQILGGTLNLDICMAVGGFDMMEQSLKLSRKPHIIIATPGRFLDLLKGENFDLKNLKYIVFDEADRLLGKESSFMQHEIPQIMKIVSPQPHCRLLFFSATMNASAQTFYAKYCANASNEKLSLFNCNMELGVAKTITQRFMLVPSQVRDGYLVNLLQSHLADKTVIIFVGKCKTCELIWKMLGELKISAARLHSKLTQSQRVKSLSKFKNGNFSRLIVTDVGSRGLDIPSVDVVINFDMSPDFRDYVHRVGRTGRNGRKGIAISFVNELDVHLFENLQKKIECTIEPYENTPKEKEIVEKLNAISAAKRKASLALHDSNFGAREKKYLNKAI